MVPFDELPASATPRVARLTITPDATTLRILGGVSLPLTISGGRSSEPLLGALAEYTNGQAVYVDATWTSSDGDVAAVVDATLNTRKRGSTILTARFEGQTDSVELVVDGGFFGRWSGTYVVEQCDANSGSMLDVLCRPPSAGRSGIAPVGATFPITIDVPDSTGADITARISLGIAEGVLPGKNLGGGLFQVLGDLPTPGGTVSVVDWNIRGLDDVMEGQAQYHVRLQGVQGAGAVVLRLVNVVRQ